MVNWTENPYTVRFNANGGTGTMGDLNCTYGTGKTLTACAFTRKGYAFAGWAKSSGGAVMYADRAKVTDAATSDDYSPAVPGDRGIGAVAAPVAETATVRCLARDFDEGAGEGVACGASVGMVLPTDWALGHL